MSALQEGQITVSQKKKKYDEKCNSFLEETPTHAVVSSVDLHILRWTHAGVVAQSVVAGTGSTDPNVSSALINICT